MVNAAGKTVTTGDISVGVSGGLSVNVGTLDVSGASLNVASGATFTTGTEGEFIVKAANFGTFEQSGAYTFNGSVQQKLDNDGNLASKNVGFTGMQYTAYNTLLSNFKTNAVTGSGTFELDGVSINTSTTYLVDTEKQLNYQ